jgi:hypothetical protein
MSIRHLDCRLMYRLCIIQLVRYLLVLITIIFDVIYHRIGVSSLALSASAHNEPGDERQYR